VFRTSPPLFRASSFFRFRRGVSHEPATVRSSVILPVPTRSPTVYFHLHLYLRPLGTARRHHRRSPSSAKAHPPAVFQFRPSSISGRFPVPASPQIRELLVPPYPVVRGCCRDHDWGSIKQHHHHQIRGKLILEFSRFLVG
jgi:hypothetical protein